MSETINIALVSDIHIGYAAYGSRTFEQDSSVFCSGFIEDIKRRLASIDLILVGGDLFNRSSPHIRALMEGHSFLKELDGLGIPVFVVAGNHDVPATPGLPCIFGIFDHLRNVRLIHGDVREEIIRLADGRTVNVVGVPHMHDVQQWRESILESSVVENVDANVLLTHASVSSGTETFSHGRFDELSLNSDDLDDLEGFDLIGLGHYHQYIKVRPGVLYPGSPYPLRRTDSSQGKRGYVIATISQNGVEAELIHIPHRRYIEYPHVDLATSLLDELGIIESIIEQHSTESVDERLPPVGYIDVVNVPENDPLNERVIRENLLNHGFAHVSVRASYSRSPMEFSLGSSTFEMAPVEDMFEEFLRCRVEDETQRISLMQSAHEILEGEVVE